MPPKNTGFNFINYSGNDIYLPEDKQVEFDETTGTFVNVPNGPPALEGQKTPAFTGRKQYNGRWTKSYRKYVETYKNYADFNIPFEVDSAGNALTVKDRPAPIAKFKNNKFKTTIVPKKDFAFRKGIVRQAPTRTVSITYQHGIDKGITTVLRPILENSTSRVVIEIPNLINGELQLSGNYKNTDQYRVFSLFYIRSDVNIFDENPRDSYTINIYFMDKLNYTPKRNEQVFANSLDNDCWAKAPMAFLINNPTKNNEKKLVHLKKIIKKYPNGLPEDKIQDTLCNRTLGFGVDVFTPTGANICSVRPKDTTKGYKLFRYMNTSYNHIEYNELYDKDRVIIEIPTQQEMIKILEDRGDKPMLYKKSSRIQGGNHIAWIAFDDKKYVLCDPLEEKRKKWLERNNIKNLYGDNDDKNYIEFINQATYVNGSHFITHMSQEDVEEQDIKKAYTSFKYADEYDHYKFPENCITDFHECKGQDTLNVIQKIGWTQIKNIKKGTGYHWIDDLINLKENGVYPNPELMCLYNLGFRFECQYTAWTLENRDIDFDEEMNEVNHVDFKKQKEYAIIAGYTLQYAKTKTVVFRYEEEPTKEWLENICYYDETIFCTYHNQEQKEIVFQKQNNKICSSNHIGSYITAYVRNIMYKQLVKLAKAGLDESNIHGIRSDAIKLEKGYGYLFDEKVFKKKEDDKKPVCLIPDDMKDYHNSKITSTEWEATKWSDYGKYVVCIGAGGCGKTYSLAMNEGYCSPTLCVPTNKLRATKEEEFKDCKNLDVWTHHQSLGLEKIVFKKGEKQLVECNNKLKRKSYCGNLYIDEITMVNNHDIETAIKSLNDHFKGRVWIMGDWNIKSGMVYQLKAMDDTHFKQELIMDLKPDIKLFSRNYRIKDDEIFKTKLLKIRSLMDKNYHNEKTVLPQLTDHIVTKLFPEQCISCSNAIEMYDDNDMLISSTHERVNYFNDEISKKQLKKKYIITVTNEKLQLYKGEIYHDDEKISKYSSKKLAYATTIHQVQGETFASRLFIDTHNIFEWGMLYTAISRLKTEKNVYLII